MKKHIRHIQYGLAGTTLALPRLAGARARLAADPASGSRRESKATDDSP
jgi:hypothetical protein